MSVTDHVDNDDDDENVAALGLGELADLTVFNEADTSSYDVRNLLVLPFPTKQCQDSGYCYRGRVMG